MPDEIEFYKKPSFELWIKDRGIFKKWTREGNLWMPENHKQAEVQETTSEEEKIQFTTCVSLDVESKSNLDRYYQNAVNKMWDAYGSYVHGNFDPPISKEETLENELKALPELDYKDI